MAIQSPFKKYGRGQRQADIETDFSNGMMFTDGTVSEGYVKTLVNFDFTQDGKDALKPRAALTVREVIVSDVVTVLSDESDFLDDSVLIKYSKECVENGSDYRQFILGKPDVGSGGKPLNVGTLWLVTSKADEIEYEGLDSSASLVCSASAKSAFYSTESAEIHGMKLTESVKTSFPVGTFMGNSFYFFSNSSNGVLKKTVFNTNRYVFDTVPVKTLMASEAVNYGYNILAANPYSFSDANGARSFQMNGILPYNGAFGDEEPYPDLLMNPKSNVRVWFRCNYDVVPTNEYNIVWSWKEVGGNDEWTEFYSEPSFTSENTPVLQASLVVPLKEIMVRCEAYNITEPSIVETAMTVGFDFTLDVDNSALNIQPEKYDLSTATGMMSWKNRLVVWGLPKDPTILFISDLNEPGYFPYPNNISVFDEPIIAVIELMDNLMVFTKSKIHQVSLNSDGYTWASTVIQSNLRVESWDKHLIQPVRNMLYFKSGNYYYMMVPKARSETGELTLAPITTPITDFFNNFKINVRNIFKECFKEINSEGEVVQHAPEELLTYYNFIDYENIHNYYVYQFEDVYVHLDIIYNTVDRYWKINVYESAHFLYPFRNDATHNGLLAITNVINVTDVDNDTEYHKRIIQLFEYNDNEIEDVYILAGTDFYFSSSHAGAYVSSLTLNVPESEVTYDSERKCMILDSKYIKGGKPYEGVLGFIDASTWVGGFNVASIKESERESLNTLRKNTVFPNKQMIDTGYRDSNLFINKRYRELQLQINNINNSDMEFGMDFQIAGEPRNTDFIYEVSQVIDELREGQGIVYIDATPYMYVDADNIHKVNNWMLEHSELYSDISLWKVRASISGKGSAPRLRLFTRKMFNYQLLSINWVYREMNMR